jgi:hypothetical protein
MPAKEKGLSPGTVYGCRVAVQTPKGGGEEGTPVFLASGSSVYHTVVPNILVQKIVKGKEGVSIPNILDHPIDAHKIELMQHLAEIQSLRIKESEGNKEESLAI